MDFSSYPNLSFNLDCGRLVKVHAFIWQPSYQEQIEVKSGSISKTIQVERKEDLYWRLFGKCQVHVINAEYVDMFINHPPRLPNSTVTVLLSSEAINSGAIYSELVVELYMDFKEGLVLESVLQGSLHDLDWGSLAIDVVDQDKSGQQHGDLGLVRVVH